MGEGDERDGKETHGGCIRGCNGSTRAQFRKEELTEGSGRPSLADLTHGEVVVLVGLGEQPQEAQEILV